MNKIRNTKDLDKAILQLKKEVVQKELELNRHVESLIKDFDAGALITSGFKSIFKTDSSNKYLISTGLSIALGIFADKILSKRSNFILKYGLAQAFMNLVTRFIDERWNPDLYRKIREYLSKSPTETHTQEAVSKENKSKETESE